MRDLTTFVTIIRENGYTNGHIGRFNTQYLLKISSNIEQLPVRSLPRRLVAGRGAGAGVPHARSSAVGSRTIAWYMDAPPAVAGVRS